MQIWTFDIFGNFNICWPIFTILFFTPNFFLFRMLDGYQMHLISWKNLVLNTLSFLATTSRKCRPPYLSMNKNMTKYHWKIFLQKMIRPNLKICFEQQHTIHLRKHKMKTFKILIITAHHMCISTNCKLQFMHLCVYIVHVKAVDQKLFLDME